MFNGVEGPQGIAMACNHNGEIVSQAGLIVCLCIVLVERRFELFASLDWVACGVMVVVISIGFDL